VAPKGPQAKPELHTRPIRQKITELGQSTAVGMGAAVVCNWRGVGTETHV
jgi:hypothetical protein